MPPTPIVAALVMLIALCASPARAAITTGSIEGRVTDKLSGKLLPGVTVVVSGPALGGEQTEFTDSNGHYIVTDLPPAEYVVRFYYSSVTVERLRVLVAVDQTIFLATAMPDASGSTQTFVVVEHTPAVDVATSQSATSVDSDLVRNTPLGRSYASVLTLAPGAANDAVGVSMSGASGPENGFLLDGTNTTAPIYGLLGSPLSLEFIKETEIITGGANAEYGRSTGGVVNVITKSGTNEFHGGLWFFDSPFMLTPNRIERPGEAIASIRKYAGVDGRGADHAFDFGLDLGGPIVKNRVFFYAGFAPSFITESYDRILRTQTASNLDPGQRSGSYDGDRPDQPLDCPSWSKGQDPALCAPAQQSLSSSAKTVDLPQQFTRHYESQSRLYNYIAKLGLRFDDNNSLNITYTGSPSTFNGAFQNPLAPVSPLIAFAGMNGNPNAVQFTNNIQVHDVSLRFTSKLLDHRLLLDVFAGYHMQSSDTAPSTPEGNASGQNIDGRANIPLTTYEPGITPCLPQPIHGVRWNPCPVSNYTDGGFGPIASVKSERLSAGASLTWFARFFGLHSIKLGGDFEDVTYHNRIRYSGGPSSGLFETFGDGSGNGIAAVARAQFGTRDATDPSKINVLADGYSAETSTLNESLYLRDSYSLSFAPGLTLNAGVRWEAQQLRDTTGTTRIGIYDNIAPRLGFAYDFTRKGRSKIYFSYGRFYESLPLDINDRSFGAGGVLVQVTDPAGCGLAATTPATRVNTNNCRFGTPQAADLSGGVLAKVAPNLQGQYSNEVTAGIQYDVGYALVLGAGYIHRDLGNIVEDVSPDHANFIIANPGRPTDPGVVRNLQGQIAAASDPARVADLKNQLALYQGVAAFDKPTRDYNALVLTATKRLSHNVTVLASYTYSRTIGNYPGLYQSSTGQLDPNTSTQYDLRELLTNRSGPLPSDRPHNFKLLGAYFIPLGGESGLTLGLNFSAVSGVPIDVLGVHPIYLQNETFILPRGAGGRTPTITQLDLRVAFSKQFGKGLRMELSADVFNLLNEQGVTMVDTLWTLDRVLPIAGGTTADLANLRSTSGAPARLNPNYGQPTQYQNPLSARFGARVSF